MTSKLIRDIVEVDLFKEGQNSDLFVGRPFYIDYNKANVLVCDEWKYQVKGIPEGAFLLAFYDNPYDEQIDEVLLLRVIKPTGLPTDSNVISSMVEYYKDNLNTSGKKTDLDDFTRYEFSFSGVECRMLGSFYKCIVKDRNNKQKEVTEFGADVENFYSSHNYKVFKATDRVLEYIVNQRDKDIIPGNESEFPIGKVRYSSSRRFTRQDVSISDVNVYINPGDMLGKRTALFGMTRTGKSNTVKKIIEATVEISKKAKGNLEKDTKLLQKKDEHQPSLFNLEELLESFDKNGFPKYPVGQIIFDINGEYANKNLQDKGTAIFDLFAEQTIRYSTLNKKDFRVMKINFYKEIEAGFEFISSYFHANGISAGYLENFLSIDLTIPPTYDGFNDVSKRYDRKVAAYKCCLYKANFPLSDSTVKFVGNSKINDKVITGKTIDPSKSISYDDACTWFEWVWENYAKDNFFIDKKQKEGKEWADEDLKSLLAMLTQFRNPNKKGKMYGYKALSRKDILSLHTNKTESSFETDIINHLREGKIVIVDLSQGNPTVQATFSEKICRKIFTDSMDRFTNSVSNNFIQFYFEEAHNLFPKKDDKDLSQIYNRIAKEGAKLYLGMIYATQEVSSISSNILKNTQNWFIAHLNNEDETRELKKYYDFADFTQSLIKFSAKNDQGFVRMKTYSNPFVVPVQVDQFLANK